MDSRGEPPLRASNVAASTAAVELVDKVGRTGGGEGVLQGADRDAAGDGDDAGLDDREGQSHGGTDALLDLRMKRIS